MKKNIAIAFLLILFFLPVSAQQPLRREVTLYNPYKPTLNEARKKSYLPEISDTSAFRPEFRYDVTTNPFMPVYAVSPIKAATLQPEPLNKLYRSYVNLGYGNNNSPLAEVSITNERSKKGSLGFYGRHYSNNGYFTNDAKQKINASYMDNDLSLFGRKFYREGVIGASIDYNQMTRHAYGFKPENPFNLTRKESRLNYGNLGANLSVESARLDSSAFTYDFELRYNYFYNSSELQYGITGVDPGYQHNIGFDGLMSKSFRGFYVGAGLEFDNYNQPSFLDYPKYVAAINPFVTKSSSLWNFRLGLQAVIARGLEESAGLYVYPDVQFGFNIVPSYINFFTALKGKLDRNDPMNIVRENPYLLPGMIYTDVPFTDHQLIVQAGLKGNTGIEGTYELSASYSLVSDMLFYSNIYSMHALLGTGNFFKPITDDVDLLNVHGEMNGKISDKISFSSALNFYKYTLTTLDIPLNKPSWDALLGIRYNLRDKILAGIELTGIGERKTSALASQPAHVNMNLVTEYRYSKILSFWARINEMSYQRYYEWENYPSHMFQFMVGFTYSL
ncbi:MAG TPA: hypothetical protein VK213_11255 [Bacteroidales bacterium]|nr:hypothetical protein [Bacteroidales bacterium]